MGAVACGGPAGEPATAQSNDPLIYGADDRREVYEVSDPTELALADATAAVLDVRNLTSISGGYAIDTSVSFGAAYSLCSSEPYRNQPTTADCTGFLVAPDLLATAGHCITASSCSSTYFAFGFEMVNASTVRSQVPTADVYRCAHVVARQETSTNDFAVVRLDRAVQGHTPLNIRRSGTVSFGAPLVVAGHPAGIPLKVAGGATVQGNSQANYFEANVDTYGGNSGSPIIDANSGMVEGILVRGNTDFKRKGRCYVSNTCSNSGCPGWEDATRITNIAPFVPGAPQCQTDADCSDSDPCNGVERCNSGSCGAGTSVDCSDPAGACTSDVCVAQSATTYVCSNPPVSCDDGDACTVDLCDAVTGCAQTPVVCPAGESCSGGVCLPIPQCGGRNASCTTNNDCCSGRCRANKGKCR